MSESWWDEPITAETVLPNGGFSRSNPLSHYRFQSVRFGGLRTYKPKRPTGLAKQFPGWLPDNSVGIVGGKHQVRIPVSVRNELHSRDWQATFLCGYSPRCLAYFRLNRTDRHIRRDPFPAEGIFFKEFNLWVDLAIPQLSSSGSNLLLPVPPPLCEVVRADYDPPFLDAFGTTPSSPAFILSYDRLGNLFFERGRYWAPRCHVLFGNPVPESIWEECEREEEERHQTAQSGRERSFEAPPYSKL